MPAFDDHPVLLILRRHAVTQTDLAKRSGVSRSTVDQIVQGRVRHINPAVLRTLSEISGNPPAIIADAVTSWFNTPTSYTPLPRTRAVLALDPNELYQYFRTFADWRREFADNPTNFASLIRVNRLTVKKYEEGKFLGGMPAALHTALVRELGLSDDYVLALGRLKSEVATHV